MSVDPLTAGMNLLNKGLSVVFPDPVKRAEAQVQIQTAINKGDFDMTSLARDVVVAEASGESWIQRSWRPLLMLWFAGLIGAYWFGYTAPNLPESSINKLLDIVNMGVGGYVVGRSVEKTAKQVAIALEKLKK
tara:strand:- start:1211 stop:1609 length:399 start_codon:yes stop_codon:yes gene_type:complete